MQPRFDGGEVRWNTATNESDAALRAKVKRRLADAIFRWCYIHDTSLKKLSQVSDIGYAALRGYTCQKMNRLPPPIALAKLCGVIGVSADFVLCIDDKKAAGT